MPVNNAHSSACAIVTFFTPGLDEGSERPPASAADDDDVTDCIVGARAALSL